MADPKEVNSKSSRNDFSSDSESEEEEEIVEEEEEQEEEEPLSDSDEYSSDSESETLTYTRPGEPDAEEEEEENVTPEANVKRFMKVLNSKRMKKEREREDENITYQEDLFDFPYDPENWRETDLKELWGDAPLPMTKPGWDPNWVDEDEEGIIEEEFREGRDPPIAPFYVPYRKPFPVIPDNNYDISNPKSVIEELDRIEEFLNWVSVIFVDGSTYEGTVWDDLAHGKGVYVGEQGLVRYEGEWLQNDMEGHGVVEVEIPHIEPIPGSKLEAKMRAEGKIIKRDFMSPEDREWLEKDIEDTMELLDGTYEIPFYENDEWVRQFGRKPEKGRYRYAGQWKHGRMHGCGLYEVNERTTYGRFYFGELLQDTYGCDAEISAMHAGIAEVAAAKARMFINKPDGMVREERGPYSDPQHPYLYEEDDVWMAPGFINQFYEVPDYWKAYVHDVDEEREMWLNSFYKAPLRLPMPAELEHWWSTDEKPEFVLLNKEPEPDPEDPSKLVYTEEPVILHTPTGRIINYVEDEEHGLRLFWQPPLKEGEDVDPDKVEFLPLGFDEFYGRGGVVQSDNVLKRFVTSVENACKPMFDKLEKWTEEQKKATEMKIELIKKELELAEAESSLKEALEEMDEELKRMQEEEEKKAEMGLQEEDDIVPSESSNELEKTLAEKKEDYDEEEDEEDQEEVTASSFGTVDNQTSTKSDKDSKSGKAPFGASSLSFAACSLVPTVPPKLQDTFTAWKGKLSPIPSSPLSNPPSNVHVFPMEQQTPGSITFPYAVPFQNGRLRAVSRAQWPEKLISKSHTRNRSKQKTSSQIKGYQEELCFNILSLHTPLPL